MQDVCMSVRSTLQFDKVALHLRGRHTLNMCACMPLSGVFFFFFKVQVSTKHTRTQKREVTDVTLDKKD